MMVQYLDCIKVNVLIRILYYSLLGCYHYGNLDKGYLYQGSPIRALYIISYNCFTSLVF